MWKTPPDSERRRQRRPPGAGGTEGMGSLTGRGHRSPDAPRPGQGPCPPRARAGNGGGRRGVTFCSPPPLAPGCSAGKRPGRRSRRCHRAPPPRAEVPPAPPGPRGPPGAPQTGRGPSPNPGAGERARAPPTYLPRRCPSCLRGRR